MEDLGVTRYFTFTRVSPRSSDYELLVETCERIDAHLAYKSVRDSNFVVRLVGWVVLRGPPTKLQVIARLFPNFLFARLQPEVTYQGLRESLSDFVGPLGESPLFFSKDHPFVDLKKTLF